MSQTLPIALARHLSARNARLLRARRRCRGLGDNTDFLSLNSPGDSGNLLTTDWNAPVSALPTSSNPIKGAGNHPLQAAPSYPLSSELYYAFAPIAASIPVFKLLGFKALNWNQQKQFVDNYYANWIAGDYAAGYNHILSLGYKPQSLAAYMSSAKQAANEIRANGAGPQPQPISNKTNWGPIILIFAFATLVAITIS